MKNTETIKTSKTERPEGLKWKELGFQKGYERNVFKRKAAKMKKGKNNKKEG